MMMENLLYSKSTDLNVKMKVLVAQLCLTLCNPMECGPPGSAVHGDSPGNNTGVGSHSYLQGMFPIQGLNPGLLHCRQNSLSSEPPGKPDLVCSIKKIPSQQQPDHCLVTQLGTII